jgi:hypothetical protein
VVARRTRDLATVVFEMQAPALNGTCLALSLNDISVKTAGHLLLGYGQAYSCVVARRMLSDVPFSSCVCRAEQRALCKE